MFSKFFIDRPIFAAVVSIVLVLLGVLSLPHLPVEKTPNIAPPTVVVTATYPGANADVIAKTVATPLESAINGVEGMLYMSSLSSNTGLLEITITFDIGVDADMAAVRVQNRVATVEPILPEEVRRMGVKTEKRSRNFALIVSFSSDNVTLDDVFISNYVNLYVKDRLARVPGVGDVQIFGAKDFAMRLWLDPEKLRARQITIEDVLAAVRRQNIQVAAGQIGAPPTLSDQPIQLTLTTLGRLETTQQFEQIILRAEPNGRILRLGDVARIELGAAAYYWSVEYKSKPAIAVGIFATPTANTLNVVEGIKKVLKQVEKDFPKGLHYQFPYNPTLFVREAIKEVAFTLFSVAGLVVLTIFIFLADWRATLVPTVTIPVSLLATLSLMYALGLTINTLTLFGLVLAIGIVVDDAIVVVENVSRLIHEENLNGKQAAIKAMQQVSAPIIATTLVLLAVFIPIVLVGGVLGVLYAQFAITLSAAVCFSTLTALTLCPSLCAILLGKTGQNTAAFFSAIDRLIKALTHNYLSILGRVIRKSGFVLITFAALCVLSVIGFKILPTGFLPDEDEGTIFIAIRLPEGASLQRTEQVVAHVQDVLSKTEGVSQYVAISGFYLLEGAIMPNGATCFVNLKPWSERKAPHLNVFAITRRLQQQFFGIPDAFVLAFQPPPILGLGSASGFEVKVQDRAGVGYSELESIGNAIQYQAMSDPILMRINSSFRANVPQLRLDIDRDKAQTLQTPIETVFSALESNLAGIYVNDFNLFGRTFKVIAQAEPHFRHRPVDIGRLEVRNRQGKMVPLDALIKIQETVGPQLVTHHNIYPATTITGQAKPGYSSGQAIARIEQILQQILPPTMAYEWSGISYFEITTARSAVFLFFMSAVFAYLFLAAQYESWSLPLAIMLAVPLGLLGAVGLTFLRMMENNVYTQMGIVLLIGIVCKTAILLVEFAHQLHLQGEAVEQAALSAARIRFRPILMTALTTALGTLPLAVATGAGAAARQSLGTSVFGGMIVATFLGVLMIPSFYLIVEKTTDKIKSFRKKLSRKSNKS